jgi:hypothetical protein
VDRQPPDEWFRLLASWSQELLSATDRIHFFIGERHQPTKGGYREALLRRLLRRVLPDRFRVSTGFIYRWNEPPSRQLDVVIWDAQNHSALLEEGEFAILTAESVAAVVEVKSILSAAEMRASLELLSPNWWVNWRYRPEDSTVGLPQQATNVPFRAIFGYGTPHKDADATAGLVFRELSSFYRRFGNDAKPALEHTYGGNLWWSNMIDVVCFAYGPQIEQTSVLVDCDDGKGYSAPGFASYAGHLPGEDSIHENIAVGRFCMNLLQTLSRWPENEAARETLRASAATTDPGVCCFGQFPAVPRRLRVWGQDVPPETLWYPDPPLWMVDPAEGREEET